LTQILTAATPNFIVQVSDRLVVTMRGGEIQDHDIFANKTVVYRASDALVTIGYSGVAYINNVPTDEWIAAILFGEPLRGPDGKGFVLRTGGGARPHQIGYSIKVLRDALGALTADSVDKYGIYLTIAGWQAERVGQRPVMIELSRIGGKISLEKAPRVWPKTRNFLIASIGHKLGQDEIRGALLPYRSAQPIGPPLPPETVEQIFADVIRGTSSQSASVGSHLLSVVLMRPDLGKSGCRFLPMEPHFAVLSSDRGSHHVQVAHSPWLVSSGCARAPCIEIGDSVLELDGYPFHIFGAPGKDGVVGLSSHVRRPPPPK
jgi:hypothetical protein